MRIGSRSVLIIAVVLVCGMQLDAQQGKPNPGSSPPPTSTGVPPGLNYPSQTLQRFISPPQGQDFVFLCYSLAPIISSTAPFSLQSAGDVGESKVKCQTVDSDHPLKSGNKIVLALDTGLIDRSRIQNLNINITFTQGTTISQRPVRPSISGNVPFAALAAPDHVFYFVATDKLVGDAIPQLSVTLLYDPPVPGQAWAAKTIYPAGSIVIGQSGGHFFQAQSGGMSGDTYPTAALTPVLPDNVTDNTCQWSPYGISPPSGSGVSASPWLPNNQYKPKDVVYDPATTIFYVEAANPAGGGTCTSDSSSHFLSAPPPAKPEPKTIPNTMDNDSGVMQWKYLGDSCPPGTPLRKPDTDYPAHTRVCDNGASVARLYESTVAGHSNLYDLHFDNPSTKPSFIVDPGAGRETWVYIRDGCDVGQNTPDWQANFEYVLDPANPIRICRRGRPNRLFGLYRAGHSAAAPPSFVLPPIITIERSIGVEWQYAGDACDPQSVPQWQPNHLYLTIGAGVCERGPITHLYTVVTTGRSGGARPYFENPGNQPVPPMWADIGLYPPPAVTSGSATETQTNAISIPLAQVHALAYYNIATGVVVTTIRVPSFAYTTPPAINNGTPAKVGSSLLIDPVITLTRYFWGFDAEAKEHASDWRPGLSFSFSLSSPTSNFYFGGSSEPLRYVQVEYGFALAKVPRLSPGAFAPSSSTTPATQQVFAKGGYLGLSFNLSDFVKYLVGKGS
jgi:hypothetical protein